MSDDRRRFFVRELRDFGGAWHRLHDQIRAYTDVPILGESEDERRDLKEWAIAQHDLVTELALLIDAMERRDDDRRRLEAQAGQAKLP